MTRPVDIAYQFIKQKILDGTFQPAQKLNEIDLSSSIGVSRNTVKKALFKLQQEQLVEIKDNIGANVKSYTLDEVINYFEIREVLEGLVASRATANMTELQLEEMSETLKKMEDHLQNNRYDEYSKLNKVFHGIIYEASQNKQAVDMIKVIKTQLSRYQIRTLLVPGRNQNSFHEHKNILAALKSRDEESVKKEIMKHISNIRNTIRENSSFLL
ncbi:GntR family transcriptional regulator [Lentibacillus populi]|uniref:GntR family transcriptional regulator n=1 Tax=Lentibacillus populi TaxID=1827502 RepID=A0A9W5TYQ1_9BACI|nr:GntR family transcriptional regulator [Lentibacillus populi]GGB48215.1 GntR family transcriptional regulator [Lentibacillus populi]